MPIIITIANNKTKKTNTVFIGRPYENLAATIGTAASAIHSVSKETGLSQDAVKNVFMERVEKTLKKMEGEDHGQ